MIRYYWVDPDYPDYRAIGTQGYRSTRAVFRRLRELVRLYDMVWINT